MTATLLPEPRPAAARAGVPLRGMAKSLLQLGGARYADLLLATVEGPLSEAALRAATRALTERHPQLRADLRTDTYAVVLRPTAPTSLPLTWGRGDPDNVVHELLHAPYADGPTGWRLRAIPDGGRTHLVLAVHHALVDGPALSVLLLDLLRALAGDDLGPPLPWPAPITLSPPWSWPLTQRIAARVWTWRAGRSQRRPLLPARGEPGTVWHRATLSPGVVPRLVTAARAHDTTVGGALIAAAWSATAELRPGVSFPVETMVDGRRDQPDAAPVGMYATGALALLGAVPADPWARARQATRTLKRQLAWGVHHAAPAIAACVPDTPARLRDAGIDLHTGGGCAATLQVSNVGAWRGPEEIGGRRIVGVWSATPAIPTSPALLVWLRTLGDTGCLSARSQRAVLDGPSLQAWLDRVTHHLDRMAHP